MSQSPTVLIAGALGLMGTRTTEVMRKKGWNVLRGARRKQDKADFRYIDLEDEKTFEAALEGVDLIFNVVRGPDFALEQHVLRTGGLLVSSAAVPPPEVRRLREEYPGAKGTAVMNAGLVGPVQLAIKKILDVARSADTMRLSFLWECKGDCGGSSGNSKKNFYSSAKKHPTTRIDYGAPLGIYEVPMMTIPFCPETIMQGTRQLFAAGYDDREANDLLLFMNEHGLLDRMPAEFFSRPNVTAWVEGKPSRDHMVATIDTYKDGEPLFAGRLHYLGDWYSSAICNWIISDALLKGQGSKSSGIYDAGDMFESFDMFELELARNSITLEMADKSMASGL